MDGRRKRVMTALEFGRTGQFPKDLGSMGASGVSCFAYSRLVAALGLPPRLPRVYQTGELLALVDTDVLDAFDCDCVLVWEDKYTNAFDEPERWHPYDFNGRLPALVHTPEEFQAQSDGTITTGNAIMRPDSYAFYPRTAGMSVYSAEDIPKQDLQAVRSGLKAARFTDERIRSIGSYCRRARKATDRAIVFIGLQAAITILAGGGWPRFSMLCLTEPDYVHELHQILADHAIAQLELLLPEIARDVDVLDMSSDDQGTQQSTILPPRVYAELFAPYCRQINDVVHRLAPQVKTMRHCCGAIYDIIDHIIGEGYNVLNPVQWCAGEHSYKEWKDKCRGRIALWGGGVNIQKTLPLGNEDDVRKEVAEVVSCLAEDSGYVFAPMHNLLPEVPPENIIAMYETAAGIVTGRQT